MMPHRRKQHAPRVRPEDWARHEKTIRVIYDAEGLPRLMKRMEREYQFVATKSQYETRFHKWGIKKYKTQRSIPGIEEAARESEFQQPSSFNRQRGLVHASVHFEQLDQNHQNHQQQQQQTNVEQELISRASHNEEIHLDDTTIIKETLPIAVTSSLPFWDFCSIHPSLRGNDGSSSVPLFSFSPSNNQLEESFDEDTQILPNTSLMADSRSGSGGQQAQVTLRTTEPMNSLAGELSNLDSVLSRDNFITQMKEITKRVKTLFPTSWASIPPESNPAGSSASLTEVSWMSSTYTRLLIFGISNNFAGMEDVSYVHVWQYLRSRSMEDLIRFLKVIPGPTSRALAEKLFACAIRDGDFNNVNRLLHANIGVDINAKFEGNSVLRYACEAGDYLTVQVLLHHGADHSKFPYSQHWITPLENKLGNNTVVGLNALLIRIIELVQTIDKSFMSFINTLLTEYGLRPCVHIMTEAVITCNATLFRTLLASSNPQNFMQWFQRGIFHKALKFLDHSGAIEVTQLLFEQLGSTNTPSNLRTLIDLPIGFRPMIPVSKIQNRRPVPVPDVKTGGWISYFKGSTILEISASTGNAELFYKLVQDYGLIPSLQVLARAIEGGQEEVVNFIMSNYSHKMELEHESGAHATALSAAIRSQSSDLIAKLIDLGAWDNLRYRVHYYYALAASIDAGYTRIFDAIVKEDSPYDPKLLGYCLARAIANGRDDMALKLISLGAEVTSVPRSLPDLGEQKSPLELALMHRNELISTAIINSPLFNQFQPNRVAGDVIWDYLITWKNYNIIQAFLRKYKYNFGPAGALSYEYPILLSVKANDIDLLKMFISVGFEGTKGLDDCQSVLSAAIDNDCHDIFCYLLDLGSDLTSYDTLQSAARCPVPYRNKLLIAIRQRYSYNNTAVMLRVLQCFVRSGDYDAVAYLMEITDPENEASTNMGSILLYDAIRYCPSRQLDILKLLLARPVELDAVDSNHETVLLAAIEYGNLEIVKLILDSGADVNGIGVYGASYSPLQKAVAKGDYNMVQYLITRGAVAKSPAISRMGKTALQIAAGKGFIGIIELLLRHDAEVDAPGAMRQGFTALVQAAVYGRLDAVQLLLNCGAKYDGEFGRRQFVYAMMAATTKGHIVVADVIKSHLPDQILREILLSTDYADEEWDDKLDQLIDLHHI
ncbi:hypothetical protein BX600DRAFT_493725 [Xylariales sp. PMI_506]|nr:hypothetical protein BX600DRAFT_493725 [Xylariales sp. PMI_506]